MPKVASNLGHPRPSWKDLFAVDSEHCPSWYGQTLIEAERAFWDNAMGDGFYDWYEAHRETPIEVARPRPRATRPIQLILWEVDHSYQLELESF